MPTKYHGVKSGLKNLFLRQGELKQATKPDTLPCHAQIQDSHL